MAYTDDWESLMNGVFGAGGKLKFGGAQPVSYTHLEQPLVLGQFAQRVGAGDVSGAVQIGSAAVHQQKALALQMCIRDRCRYCAVLAGLPTARPQMVTGTWCALAAAITMAISVFMAGLAGR